jgi:hypothetical protein
VDEAGYAESHPHTNQHQQQRQAAQKHVCAGLCSGQGGLQQGLGAQPNLGDRHQA